MDLDVTESANHEIQEYGQSTSVVGGYGSY